VRHKDDMKRILPLIWLLVSSALGQTVYVPVDHWVYDFLERLETQRIVPVLLSGAKPLTRSEIAGHLAPLYRADSLTFKFTAVQRQQLDYLAVEFQEELALRRRASSLDKLTRHRWIDPWLPDAVYRNGRNFLSIDSPPFQLYVDPVLTRQRMWTTADSLAGTEKVFENAQGLQLRGSVGRVGFYVHVADHQEWGTRRYPGIVNYTRERLGFVRGNGKGLDHDETQAYLLYQYKYFTVSFGKDVNRWGPGCFGQLALSDYPTSYDQLKYSIAGRRIRFTGLAAVLQHYTSAFFTGGHEEKYLAGHRLEFAPLNWLNIGLHETIVYGGRKFEAAYLNPVMFYRSAEHYLGDRDNATMGLDLEMTPVRGCTFYGELFLDDISTSKLNTGFYGNKYAFTLGGRRVNALGIADLDLRAEYTRIRPFTYEHWGTTGYWHYATLLGHWLGPNSTGWLMEAVYRVSQPVYVKADLRLTRHGANTAEQNFGGDPFLLREPGRDPEYVNQLDGLLHTSDQLTLFASYEFLRHYFIQCEWRYTGYDHQLTEQSSRRGISRRFMLRLQVND